ncbi:MAG TPA: tetratricopeptide repeat protein, partial [Steroidobacteraceae bacterium]|nr:tetratricopeptide repeat protein [Steroidobacteraceae bacterium]
ALMNAGRYAELEGKSRALLDLQPNSGVLWQLLGVSLTGQGKDALPALKMAAHWSPNDAGAHNNLGNALGRLGQLDAAVASYRRALRLNPELAEAHNNLGNALLHLGQPIEAAASCRRAVELKPRYAEAHETLGSAYLALGRHEDALASYRRALDAEPGFAEAHNNMGNALLELGRHHDALASYRRALAINPEFAAALNNLGNGLQGLGQLADAEASYRRALQINPEFAEAQCNLGITQRLQGRTAEAQLSCRRALEIDPTSAAALAVLAESSADRGEFAAAEELFTRATQMAPQSPEGWAGLARLRKMTRADSAWAAQALRIVRQRLPARQEISLRHSIGKYFDDVGEFEQAFAEFRRANELMKLHRPKHDRQQLTQTVDSMIRFYDRDWMRRTWNGAMDSARPVFIVGMLRSGTTLAEQILASHPSVFGAGELTFWSSASAAFRSSAESAQASEGVLGRLAGEYLRLLGELSVDALRVVDKMPTNFPFLGLIHAALPNARVIHMRRNPVDTCLSIYMQHFEATVSYANDLEDLAHYYTEYLRVMNHWRSTLPGNVILEVPYEGLVRDQEAWSRKMLEFIGLPWDARCLDFHLTERAVITASKWQVRQKMHSSSVERWRSYERFLGPLLPLLACDPRVQVPASPDP